MTITYVSLSCSSFILISFHTVRSQSSLLFCYHHVDHQASSFTSSTRSSRWLFCIAIQVACPGWRPRRVLERRRGCTLLLARSCTILTWNFLLIQEDAECPLCLEEMDISDLNFKPCVCGYQVAPLTLTYRLISSLFFHRSAVFAGTISRKTLISAALPVGGYTRTMLWNSRLSPPKSVYPQLLLSKFPKHLLHSATSV